MNYTFLFTSTIEGMILQTKQPKMAAPGSGKLQRWRVGLNYICFIRNKYNMCSAFLSCYC